MGPKNEDSLTGKTFEKCRIIAKLGTGGMGSVWLAERTDGLLKRPVALKLPHAGAYGPELADRFARERDILAALRIMRAPYLPLTADAQSLLKNVPRPGKGGWINRCRLVHGPHPRAAPAFSGRHFSDARVISTGLQVRPRGCIDCNGRSAERVLMQLAQAIG